MTPLVIGTRIISDAQVAASPTIVILKTLDVSFMLLENMIVILTTLHLSFMLLANIYSTGITHDNYHLWS